MSAEKSPVWNKLTIISNFTKHLIFIVNDLTVCTTFIKEKVLHVIYNMMLHKKTLCNKLYKYHINIGTKYCSLIISAYM